MTSLPRPRTPLLDGVYGPHDVRALDRERLERLACEVRQFLEPGPGARGAAGLGVALHRVFDPHRDVVVWGDGLRRAVPAAYEVIAGKRIFVSPDGTGRERPDGRALSYAGGLARAFHLRGEAHRYVVAVVDGASLAGGAGWEALGALADTPELRIVVVVVGSDAGEVREGACSPGAVAGRSDGAPGTLGGHVAEAWRTVGGGLRVLLGPHVPWAAAGPEEAGRPLRAEESVPEGGGFLGGGRYGVGRGLREFLGTRQPSAGRNGFGDGSSDGTVPRSAGSGLLPGLLAARGGVGGLRTATGSGPVDAGRVEDVEASLRAARDVGRPTLVHCVVRTHGRSDPPYQVAGAARHDDPRTWAAVLAEELARAGAEWPEVVAVHTAGRPGEELGAFADAYPDRVIGTGHTAAHAADCAAGLAAGGLHPVLALRDDALTRRPEPVAAQRGTMFVPARPSGTDAAEPARPVPGMRCAAPRDRARLRALVHTALGLEDGPTAVYVPDGPVGPDMEPVVHDQGVDVLYRGPAGHADVLVVSVGALSPVCVDAARLLAARGVAVTVVDPGWIDPLPARLHELAAGHGLSVIVEDESRIAGVAALLGDQLRRRAAHLPLLRLTSAAAGTPLTARTLAEAVGRHLDEPDAVEARASGV